VKIQLDQTALQRRSIALLDVTDKDPRAAAERIAASEAHLRLVVTGAAGGKNRALLHRARNLDPYRAATYFLLALDLQRAGSLTAAIEHYDQAVALAPRDLRLRFHRGYALLEQARRTQSADVADAARDDFELVVGTQPKNTAAAFGALESALLGKTKRLRETLAALLARLPPQKDWLAPMTRVLYQIIFWFGVGKAKNIDQSNKKTMGEIVDCARAWLGAFPGDADLGGVIAAATAKCNTPEELCERIAAYAKDIPDVRVLRLLLRERLAEVEDPTKRLQLFEQAMSRIPPLDGIAQDYLQLVHLKAKRALAEGDLLGARAGWQTCLARDPDNPGAVENLLRLAEHEGNTDEAAQLRTQLGELQLAYARMSPRADLMLGRVAARLQAEQEKAFDSTFETVTQQGSKPTVDQTDDLLDKLTRAAAVARLAADPAARKAIAAETIRRLIDPASEAMDLGDDALAVLNQPLPEEPPVAYAYFDAAKDTPDATLLEARERSMTRWTELEAEPSRSPEGRERVRLHRERAERVTASLFDPESRAAYDASTCGVELAEACRSYTSALLRLVHMGSAIKEDEDAARRVWLADKLAVLRTPAVIAYLPTTSDGEAGFRRGLAECAFDGLLKRGFDAMNNGRPEEAIDLIAAHVDRKPGYFHLHRLYVFSIMRDPRLPLDQAAPIAQQFAARAVESAESFDPAALIGEMQRIAGDRPDHMLQRAAVSRARHFLDKDKSAQALTALWSAYPGMGMTMQNVTPAASAWVNVKPTGRGLYAWTVARSLRDNSISWYNAQSPYTQYDVRTNQVTALKIGRSAERWAKLAQQEMPAETLGDEERGQLDEAMRGLLESLEKDRRTLSGL
jgi:tetratricopeptide (TPR) repeat protein